MLNANYIKLHRKSIESQVFSDAELWRLFCWCLMRANWKEGFYCGERIEPGSFATGRKSASTELGVSESTWYRSMQKLERLGCISLKVNNRFTIVFIANWSKYQGGVNNKRTTDEQLANNGWTTGEQQMDTIEEGKEGKEGKKVKNTYRLREEFDSWYRMYPRKVARNSAHKAYCKAVEQIASDENCSEVEAVELLNRWTAERAEAISGWERQYQPHPATWLNGGRYLDPCEKPLSRVANMEALANWNPMGAAS